MIKQAIGRIKTASKTVTRTELDALDLLRSDHMKVEALLLQIRVFRDRERRTSLLRQIRSDLERHMWLEETIFYPACAQIEKFSEQIEDFYSEHQQVKDVLKELEGISPSHQRFSRLVTQLVKTIEKHVHEEEDRLFPSVRRYMDEKSFRSLNREVQEAHSGAVSTRPRRAA